MEAQVKSFMTGSPVAIQSDASALEALDLMIEHGIRHLPVTDGERRVVGILSFDDLRAAFPVPVELTAPPSVEDRFALRELSVGEVMTFAPVTARADAPLEDAAGLLAERRIGCLPVVDEAGRLDGIITETDMLHALANVLWAERRQGSPAPGAAGPPALADVLRAERLSLLAKLGHYEEHEQALTEARRETPYDLAEAGEQTSEAEFTEELAELAARRLRALDHALERADAGTLTRCESCGGDIPDARLRALPGATTCIRCARARESGV
jgi:acetoin utilization protein AcuB